MKSISYFVILLLIISCAKEEINPDDTNPPVVEEPRENEYTSTRHELTGITFDIYTPIDHNPAVELPILYFNDGDDFIGFFEKLMEGHLSKAIFVGLHSGANRLNWYTPYEDDWIRSNWGPYQSKADDYTSLLINNVIPFVESEYALKKGYRGIFGISLGGLHAAWAGLNYPEVFDFVGSLSPSFWVGDYAIILDQYERPANDNKFYFDMGTSEWNYYVPFITTLKRLGLRYGSGIFYYEVNGGAHTGTSWASRIHIPFKIFTDGVTGDVKEKEVLVECIPSQSTPGLTFQRLNPLVKYDDGIIYSLTTEASYEIIEGAGEITVDGRFEVEDESMKVKVRHDGWEEELTLINCR